MKYKVGDTVRINYDFLPDENLVDGQWPDVIYTIVQLGKIPERQTFVLVDPSDSCEGLFNESDIRPSHIMEFNEEWDRLTKE